MRKIYPLILTTFVVGSALAINPVAKTFTPVNESVKLSESGKLLREVTRRVDADKKVARSIELKTLAKVPSKEVGEASKYDGTYILTLCDNFFGNSTGEIGSMEVTVTTGNNTLTIESDEFDPITANFDASTGEVTFVNKYLGYTSSAAYSWMPFDLTSDDLFASFSATFTEDLTLTFPDYCGMGECVWTWETVSERTAAISAAQSFDAYSDYFVGFVFAQTFMGMSKGGYTFSPAGTVTYFDGLMTVNSAVDQIYSWDIAVEKCDQDEYLYRMQPYAVQNPVGNALGMGVDTETYVYVNISDPSKVYTKGRFSPYGVETFSGVNAENNFNANYYGTYSDGVISFPDPSFAYSTAQGWYLVDTEGQPNLRIVFEGAVIKDYTIEATTPSVVSADNKWTITLAKGADVASVKYMVVPLEIGYSELTEYGFDFDNFGTEVAGDSFQIDPTVSNILGAELTDPDYISVFIASYDANGIKQEQTELYLTILFDDEQEGWTTVGKTEFVDPFIAPLLGTSFTAEVDVQAKSDNSPVYRLVLPYQTFPAGFDMAGLTTSMVIDASDATWVEIPQYFSGVNLGYDMAAVGSVAALGFSKETAPATAGAVTLDGNTVKFAAKSAFIHMPLFNGAGMWSQLNAAGAFDLPAITLTVTVKDADGAAVEGATVSLDSPEIAAVDVLEDGTIITDAEGKATIDIPFSTGYFGIITVYINGVGNSVTLEGASTDKEIAVITSAIDEINAADKANVVYDLLGRRVNNPSAGIYIVNGKKTVIKK